MVNRKYILIVVFIFSGCLSQIVSLEDHAKGWVGRPLEDLKVIVNRPGSYASRIGWKEKTYQSNNGNLIYIEPDHKDCFIHFEVNPQGLIIGYRTEGKGCK